MNREHIWPFVNETVRVFEIMLGATPERVSEAEWEDAYSAYDLSAAVWISGSVEGGVVLSIPRACARGIVSRVLCEEIDEASPDLEDCVGEMVNAITARAKRALSRQGFPDLRLSLPRVSVGKDRAVWLSRDLPCVSISFVMEEFGPFCIEISIRVVGTDPSRQKARAGYVAGHDERRSTTPGRRNSLQRRGRCVASRFCWSSRR